MSYADQAYEKSVPGVGQPIYRKPTKDIIGGWRVKTPPVVESLNETYEHVIAKQGREDNVTG